ncbi:MAG: DUF6051 family protein [Planctomycetaceae bacterium]|nr:DUF6051 family protein [Planctomycetaceae bacterium]
MRYQELYNELRRTATFGPDSLSVAGGLTLRNFTFQSRIRHKFPKSVAVDAILAAVPQATDQERSDIRHLISAEDGEILENLNFRYHIIMPPGQERARKVIILFHGFNEKQWHKYLPWAADMAMRTGQAVLLFPMAFHMNRAPATWTDIRAMNRVSKIRRQIHPAVIDSSLSNVAISTRLHHLPERFIWSGLESYHDVMDLVDGIRAGTHPAIDDGADINFFSYSVGAFFGLTIMMTNKDANFSRSRYALFCGGPVFNRLSPVSKFILDSEASVILYSFLVEHLESHMRDNPALGDVLNGSVPEGWNFRSLLGYRDNLKYREDKFRNLAGRVYAIGLEQDDVVPPYEIHNTLQGSRGDIGIAVDVLDFPYMYRHEDPFPVVDRLADEVDAAFRDTFDRVAGFFGS